MKMKRKQKAQHYFRVSLAASVRTRLTLWYLAVMACIIVIFGGSLYASETFLNPDTANSKIETQLYQDSPQFAALYKQALLTTQPLADLNLKLSSKELVLLLSPDGTVLDQRGSFTGSMVQQIQARASQNTPLFDLAVTQSSAGGWRWWWQAEQISYHSQTYHLLLTPVFEQNARIATLVVGLPLGGPASLFQIWLLHGILALLAASLGGYWLAGRALRPMKKIVSMANEINATDLRRRLHLQRRDEFGELAATFDHMLARLEAAFKRQMSFTADASHELRTPLTIIDLEINRALTQLERPEDYRQVLELIQAENARMAGIVNTLLMLARVDTGQMQMDLQEVDLSDIALACVERLLPLARKHQISLATGKLPEMLVRGDPQYLGPMLTNLIENGIKYSSGIGKRVSVELVCGEPGWGLVHVRDDGPGIAEEHLPLLFERFYRIDKARSRKLQMNQGGDEEPGGSGLGLSIVQWIVQAHHGQIRVESTIGAGTLFEVRLPLSRPEQCP